MSSSKSASRRTPQDSHQTVLIRLHSIPHLILLRRLRDVHERRELELAQGDGVPARVDELEEDLEDLGALGEVRGLAVRGDVGAGEGPGVRFEVLAVQMEFDAVGGLDGDVGVWGVDWYVAWRI